MSTVSQPRIRLWPAIGILLLQAGTIVYSVTAEFSNFPRFMAMMGGPALCLLLFLGYWFVLSRVPWSNRGLLPILSLVTALVVCWMAAPTTRATMWMYGVPLTLLLMTIGSALDPRMYGPGKPLLASSLVVAGWLPFLLVRLDGFDGSYFPEFAWRWSPTAEQRMALERPKSVASPSESAAAAPKLTAEDWPGFRGAQRDSRVRGVTINNDWQRKPPREVWKIAVGPAWSSFAVVGDWLYTQEQFGEEEGVVCYDAATGVERWRHQDVARFSEIVAGPGPRATPTYHDGRLYTLGAEANFNCLDPVTGQVLWSHDLMQEIGAKLPEWGFAASPLCVADQVIVFANGTEDRGLVAYHAITGEPTWHVPCDGGMNFSSAQWAELEGKSCVLFAGGKGLLAIAPETGEILWRFAPPDWNAAPMVQPQALDDASILVALGDGVGTARVGVALTEDTWNATSQWTSRQLKPAFNDYVYHNGALYGFDQNLFVCVDAATGLRHWKKGRYGFGQALLFEEQGLVLVLSETGELVLLDCNTKEHREVGRMAAIEGKTWNHPAFARGKLYVRNGEQAACIDLSPD
jgi:outer membrane protein assembly factor BamB